MVVYKMFLVHISWLMDSNLYDNISLMCSVIMYVGGAVEDEHREKFNQIQKVGSLFLSDVDRFYFVVHMPSVST